MSRKADCWDNAVAESFFGTLKQELVFRLKLQSRATTRTASPNIKTRKKVPALFKSAPAPAPAPVPEES